MLQGVSKPGLGSMNKVLDSGNFDGLGVVFVLFGNLNRERKTLITKTILKRPLISLAHYYRVDMN